MKNPYPAIFTVTLLALVTAIFFLFSNSAHAKELKYQCDGYSITLDVKEDSPIIASIWPESGPWVEIPNNDRSGDDLSLALFGVESSQLAIMGKSHSGLYLEIYRNIENYSRNIAEHKLRCRKD